MNRFGKTPENKYGNVIITDIENTEAVCLIQAKYHPYAPDLILGALNQAFPEISPEVKKIFNIS